MSCQPRCAIRLAFRASTSIFSCFPALQTGLRSNMRKHRVAWTKDVHKGGFGVNPPLSLIFTKIVLPLQRRLIVFAHVCLLICRFNANTTEWICVQISRNIVNGPKSDIWWESGLSSASRNHLTKFCRPFVHYACLRLCSAIVHFIQNNCLYFICCGWSAQTSPKRWFRKHQCDVKLWRHKQTHTKYKWHHTPLNDPPWKFSACATGLNSVIL